MIENKPEQLITAKVIGDFERDRAEHRKNNPKPSGNLTASMLGDPFQWIILKMLGVEQRTPDEYAMRKFKRGEHVEDWFVPFLSPLETQKEIVYRKVTGKVDAVVDTKDWDHPVGVIPLEVKSVKNAQYKYITGTPRRPSEGIKRSHRLQACTYALAMEAEHFAVTYIASDDYRTTTFILPTEESKDEVDFVISQAATYLRSGIVPKFQEIEKWQANPQYCKYPSYQYLTEAEILTKLAAEHPEALSKLKEVSNA